MQRNNVKYFLIQILHSTALLFATGAIIQTFLLTMGVDMDRVSVYASIVQIVQVVAMVVCLFFGDGVKNIKRFLTCIYLVLPVIFIVELAVLLTGLKNTDWIYTLVLIGSIVANFVLGLNNVVCYKMPYFVIDMSDYGKLSSFSGIFSGGIGIAVTSLLSLFVQLYDYRLVMSVAFCIGTLLWIITAILNHSYDLKKPLEEANNQETETLKTRIIKTLGVMKHPVFLKTLVPHILRGVGLGVVGLAVVLGTADSILNTETATTVALLTSLGSIVGYVVYLFMEKHLRVSVLLSIAGILLAVSLPLMTVFQNLIFFYIIYFIGYTLITIVNMCVPVLVYDCVPYEIMGSYTSLRMMLFTLGQAFPGFFMSDLIGVIGTFGVLIIAGLSFVISSIWFSLVLKKPKEIKES